MNEDKSGCLNSLLIIVIAIILFYIQSIDANLKAYNKHMCAVAGYYEDCRTKLPESLRLK